jgi:release factor glutamine methyltransferase
MSLSLHTALNHTIAVLAPHPQARPFAEILLAQLLNVARSYLYTHADELLTAAIEETWHSAMTELRQGMPLAYVLGHVEFFGLTFNVTPEVLIPRPDTETLVTQVLAHFSHSAALRVLELGTGSGAIALALAHHRPHWRITATDISASALHIAKDNAQQLHIDSVLFLQSDWFSALPIGKLFDVIISNPPYIAHDDPEIETSVRKFEPALALFAEQDGLAALENIIQTAPGYLTTPGALMVEHGYKQAALVRALFSQHGFTRIVSVADTQLKERVSIGWWC